MSDMDKAPAEAPQDTAPLPNLRFLKLLVTVLTGTMIAGLITIIALLVIRFPNGAGGRPVLPEAIALPDGLQAAAVTMGQGWYAVVTDTGELLVYDASNGALRQRVTLDLPK